MDILIVEDEAITALDLEMELEDRGFNVVGIVDTGIDAINEASELRPDIVIMDIQLKGEMDGIEAAEKISGLDIPIIYLTANGDDSTFFNANKSGVYGFVDKPFNISNLVQVIKVVFRRSRIELQKQNLAHGFIKD